MSLRIMLVAMATIAGYPASIATADIITRCGASAGHVYRLPGLLSDAQGWDHEELTQGEIMLMLDKENHVVDIITKDSMKMTSSRAEGFNTYTLVNDNTIDGMDIIIQAVNSKSKVMEHYLFHIDDHGNGTVVWGTVRAGGPLPKSSLLTAECKSPV